MTAIDGNEFVRAFKGGQPHRRAGFAHLRIDAERHDRIIVDEAEVPNATQILSEVVIIYENRAALEAVYEFRRIKLKISALPKPPIIRPRCEQPKAYAASYNRISPRGRAMSSSASTGHARPQR
jgi:hypothetical protein